MTDYVAEVVTKLYIQKIHLKNHLILPRNISDEQIEKIAQKAADKAVNKRYEKLDATADTAMHRIYNLVNGAVWAASQVGIHIFAQIAVLAAGGFGYGFFYSAQRELQAKRCGMALPIRKALVGRQAAGRLLRRKKIFCSRHTT